MRICVEYVIGVYTLTKQDGGFLFPDLPHKNTAIYVDVTSINNCTI